MIIAGIILAFLVLLAQLVAGFGAAWDSFEYNKLAAIGYFLRNATDGLYMAFVIILVSFIADKVKKYFAAAPTHGAGK